MLPDTISFPKTDAIVHRLENGLEIIVKETPGTDLVSVQGWVRTGSMYEAEFLGSGISHLVEHMVFKGAGKMGPTELAQAVQASGGYLNAYTSFERTVYWVDTLKEGFATALDVVSSLVSEAVFPPDEYEREKDVIRREMDMGKDDPGRTLGQLLFSTVFKHHPYREPIIGRRELFDALTRDDAFGYYNQRYTPDKTFVVVAGDVNTAEVIAAVEARLGSKGNRMMASVILPLEPEQTGRREAHAEFATELTKMELAWRTPDLHHPDTPALEVLGVLLGQGRSSRLYRELRERRGLVHEIGAGAYTPTQGGLFYVGAEVDPGKREEVTTAVLEAVEEIKQNGVSADEVLKARRIFLSDQLSSLTSTRGIAADLGGNWMASSNLDFTRDYLESVDRVTPEKVQEVVRTYLVEKTLSCVSLNPKGTAKTISISASHKKAAEIQKHVYDNGLTLLVREDKRLPMIQLQACFRGGLLAETPANNGLSRLMARTMIKGADGRTGEELMEMIESRGGSLASDSGGNSFSCYGGVLTPDFKLGLDLWGDCVLAPEFGADEVVREKDRQIAAIKQEEDSMMFMAFRELRKALYGTHPYHMSRHGTAESLATLTPEHLKEFHTSHVVSGNAVLAVFGDVDFDSVVDTIGRKMARIPGGYRRTPEQSGPLPTAGGLIKELTKDKKQAVLTVAFPTVPMDHPDRVALDLIDEACSDMASRMFVRIREELGLAYSVGASQILGMVPGAFVFHLSTSPEQLDFAQEELLKEISKLVSGGLTQAEIDRARMSLTGKQTMQAQSNSSLAEMVVLDELYGFGFDNRKKTLARVKSISVDEVNAVVSRYLNGGELIVRVKGDG